MSTTNNSLSILSKSGSWIRGNPGRFACMLIVAVLYGLLLACIVQPDYEGFMAAALMINFLVPPVLLIINIAAACFRKSTWKFPLGCVSGLTPAAVRSDPRVRRRSLREGRRLHLDWRMAAFMGLHGANRILHAGIHRILIRGIRLGATHQALPAGASVAHQVVALPPVGDGYVGAAVRMRLCGCSHDGEVAATPGRKTRF